MGDANIFISNGTCYTAAGKKLDSSFIPCGNAAFGHQTCCGAGDNCLGDKACFGIHGTGYGSYLTYMAGCTDPDYKDGSCPDKEGIGQFQIIYLFTPIQGEPYLTHIPPLDQPWIALTLCDNSDGVWAACSQEGNPSTLQPGSFCSCTDTAKATVAFSDANTLPNTASLPQGTGSSVQFFAGYVPTPPGTTIKETTTAPPPPPLSSKQPPAANPPPSPSEPSNVEPTTNPIQSDNLTTSPPSPPGSPSTGTNGGTTPQTGSGTDTTSPDNTNPSNPSNNTPGGLSPGAKAGIAVGAAAAVLIFLAALIALFLHHRRRKRRASTGEVENVGGGAPSNASNKKNHNSMDHPPSDISEVDGQPARPWSMRSELEGSQVPGTGLVSGAAGGGSGKEEGVGDGMLSPIAELPGSAPPGQGYGGEGREGRRRVVVGDSVVYL